MSKSKSQIHFTTSTGKSKRKSQIIYKSGDPGKQISFHFWGSLTKIGV